MLAAISQVKMADALRLQRQVSRLAMDIVVRSEDWPAPPTRALTMGEQEALVIRELEVIHALPKGLARADIGLLVLADGTPVTPVGKTETATQVVSDENIVRDGTACGDKDPTPSGATHGTRRR